MNEIVKGVLIALISGSIVAGVGYFSIVRDNQIRIDNLEKQVTELSQEVKQTQKAVNKLAVILATANPELGSSIADIPLLQLDDEAVKSLLGLKEKKKANNQNR
ncbi:hypothetical protein, partial [Desulfocicer niacini]